MKTRYGPYSYSRIKTYRECPRKFKLVYIDGLKEDKTQNITPMLEGSLFHKFAEVFDRARIQGAVLSVDLAMKAALLAMEETVPIESIKEVEIMAEAYATNPQPVENLMAVEYKWGVDADWNQCDYDDPEALLRGIWDKFYIDGGFVEVKDHKTSRLANSDPLQRDCYVAPVPCIFPQVSAVEFSFLYNRIGWIDTYSLSREGLDMAKQMVSHLIGQIEADETFAPVDGAECHNCPFRPHCIKDIRAVADDAIFAAEPRTLEEAMEVALNIISAEKAIAQAKRFLKNFVEKNGDVTAGGKTFRISSSQTWSKVDVLDLLAVLKNHDIQEWWKCVSPNWKAIRGAIADHPEIEEKLDTIGKRTLKQSFGSVKSEVADMEGDRENEEN